MKIIVQKDVEVELPNGFYWDPITKHAFWVSEKKIIDLTFTEKYVSMEIVDDAWTPNIARDIWETFCEHGVRHEHPRLEKAMRSIADLYNLLDGEEDEQKETIF